MSNIGDTDKIACNSSQTSEGQLVRGGAVQKLLVQLGEGSQKIIGVTGEKSRSPICSPTLFVMLYGAQLGDLRLYGCQL